MTVARRIVSAMFACTFGLQSAGCVHTQREPRSYPGPLVDASSITPDMFLRQRLTIQIRGRALRLEAAMQKHGDSLTLVGLLPFGAKAFVLEQYRSDVRMLSGFQQMLPFPPEYVLQDVHRTFFRHISAAPLPDGEHRLRGDQEETRERWRDGRLLQRSFRRLDHKPRGTIRIDYGKGISANRMPPRIRVHNGWLDYDVLIETLEYQLLPSVTEPPPPRSTP